MAHYQQLQSYISELAERALESAQATADQTREHVSRLSRLLMLGSLAIILLAIGVTLYIGRVISAPITEVIDVLHSNSAGKEVANIPSPQSLDEQRRKTN